MDGISETEMADSCRRRCAECGRSFRPSRGHQLYCSGRHRRTALLRRRRARESIQAPDPPPQIVCAELLEQAQTERDRMGMPRLEIDPYLEARAREIEAEEQVRLWMQRLHERREVVLQTHDPGYARAVKRLSPTELLAVPDAAIAAGLCSTDGRIGFIVYGARR